MVYLALRCFTSDGCYLLKTIYILVEKFVLSMQHTCLSYTSVHHGGTCFVRGFETAVLPDVCYLLRMVGNFPV